MTHGALLCLTWVMLASGGVDGGPPRVDAGTLHAPGGAASADVKAAPTPEPDGGAPGAAAPSIPAKTPAAAPPPPAGPDGAASPAPGAGTTTGTSAGGLKAVVASAAKETARAGARAAAALAFEQLRARLPKLQEEMQELAIKQRTKGRERVQFFLMLFPVLALILFPIWLWWRKYFRRARENAISRGRILYSAFVATVFIVVLLEVFVQLFLVLETAKNRLAIARPSHLLVVEALESSLEIGKSLADPVGAEPTGQQRPKPVGAPAAATKARAPRPSLRAITPAILDVVSGRKSPETFLNSVIRYASEISKSGALDYGSLIFRYGRPFLDYVWALLLGIALLLFFRFAGPSIREIASHVSGEAKPGSSLLGTALRKMIWEALVVVSFIIPYAVITTFIGFVAYMVIGLGAPGIVESLFAAIDRLVAEDVATWLVIASFSGLFLFMVELVVLLMAVSAVLLGSWMRYLHFQGGTDRLRRLGRFSWHFLTTLLRLLPALVIVTAVLFLGLKALDQNRASLGTTIEMLVPVFMLVSLNLLLWLARFFKGLKRGLSAEAWSPATTGVVEAEPAPPAHVELP